MEGQTRTYEVRGMSCDHCVLSVTEEIAELGDVEVVTLGLDGRLTVRGPGVSDERIAAAVEEAGYEAAAVAS